MKNLFLLPVLIIALAACNNQNKTAEDKTSYNDSTLWKDYSYPIDQIGKGKTLVYKRVGEKNADIFEDVHLISELGKQYLISKFYASSMNYDSSKYDINGKLIESYTFMLSGISDNVYLSHPPIIQNFHVQNYFPVKGVILQDTLIDTEKKLKKHIRQIVYLKNDTSITFKDEVEYLKDTVITWQGKQYDCIVTTGKRIIEHANKDYTMHYTNESGVSYFAKGIGIIRYTRNTHNNSVKIIELVEIKDYSLPHAAGYGVGKN
ncbi:MAG: hypothetical protein AB7G44_15885 [Bacteroidia bacterium]